jgi:hypothetical protein
VRFSHGCAESSTAIAEGLFRYLLEKLEVLATGELRLVSFLELGSHLAPEFRLEVPPMSSDVVVYVQGLPGLAWQGHFVNDGLYVPSLAIVIAVGPLKPGRECL